MSCQPITAVGLFLILLHSLPAQTGLVLNEVVSSNVTGLPDEYEEDLQNCPVPNCPNWYEDLGRSIYDGEYPDWIELYNGSDEVVQLKGYRLTDREEDERRFWTFPDVEIASGGYLIVFASGKDKREDYVHTDFKISRTGEVLSLMNSNGELVDRVDTGTIPVDYALARAPGNPAEWIVTSTPTPGAPNDGVPFLGFDDAVTATPPAGFYERFPSVSLTSTNSEAEIRYTLDGSLPTAESKEFTRPITALFGGDRVIRAQCFVDGRPTSPVLTQSYLTERTFNMPVIALTTAPEHLWDDELGLYTPGNNAREGDRVANYWNEWERPVHVEFFELDGTVGFTANAGLRIFGWGSRSNPQKSLAVMFRDRYGFDQLDYPLFPDVEIDTFKAFVLRAAGSDSRNNGTFFRDPFASGLFKGRNVDVQAFRPAVVYINGEYWGLQNIREKMNEDYLASHHPVDPDEVDIISRYWRRRHPVVIEGDDERFLAFEDFLLSNDFSQPDAYAEALNFIDLDNFLEYTAGQIYLSNFDWPGNNNKNWSPQTVDGRWRWLMYDLDYSQGFNNNSTFRFNTLTHALAPGGTGWPNPSWTTLIFRKLAESEAFQHAFANRLADLANTVLSPEQAIPQLDALEAYYAMEMEHHINRWKREGDSIASLSAWAGNVNTVRTFFMRRPEFMFDHVRDTFQLGEPTPVTIELDEALGRVRVNSVTIDAASWTGTYFAGVPIEITAVPRPGYRFVRWSGLTEESIQGESTIRLDPAELQAAIEPVFEAAPGAVNAVRIQEINYHSHPERDSGDWVELVNAFAQSMDLSGWVFQDSSSAHRFVIPQGTVLTPGGLLVLCEDAEAFAAIHPGVSCLGSFGFGLNNGGERLRLFDAEGRLMDEVEYDDEAPWPLAADGLGATLSLADAAASDWGASPDSGTPGATNSSPGEAPSSGLTIRWDGEWIVLETSAEEPRFQRSPDLETWTDWEPEVIEPAGRVRLRRPLERGALEYFRLQR